MMHIDRLRGGKVNSRGTGGAFSGGVHLFKFGSLTAYSVYMRMYMHTFVYIYICMYIYSYVVRRF